MNPPPVPAYRHPERDPDLLLLVHRALPPVPAALTRLHLIGCADCRRRLGDLRTSSYACAAAIRDPGMPLWSPPALSGATAAVFLLTAAVLLGILLLTLTVHGHHQAPAPVGGPCRPDLPNDHCR